DWRLGVRAPRDKAVAYAALHWLIKPGPHGEPAWNARRFGIMYVIWDGRIWAAYRASEGWRAYHGASEHTDHIHISFSWNGAEKHTSWWTGRVAPVDYGPCPAVPGRLAARWSRPNPRPCSMPPSPPGVYARPGDHGARVVAVQRVL